MGLSRPAVPVVFADEKSSRRGLLWYRLQKQMRRIFPVGLFCHHFAQKCLTNQIFCKIPGNSRPGIPDGLNLVVKSGINDYNFHFASDKGGGIHVTCFCPCLFVCLPVCLSVCLSVARLRKNACMDLDEILSVDRCRDMDELINFWARSGS